MSEPIALQELSDIERTARLRLIRSENVGPITFFKLLERYGSAKDALLALPALVKKGGRKKPPKIHPLGEAEDELDKLAAMGGTMICWGEHEYPPLLAHIDDAPPVLFIRGHTHLLRKRCVGVVGSRNASINGRRFAQMTASTLGGAGYLVVSGMARGIDTAAHQGALQSGTIAVLGGGVDIVYPRENQTLYNELLEVGAVVSEVPLGTTPQARHFPRRNRIISGMARAIVVLEAGAKSGSLITARMALEQGREVFAVPGPPQDPRVKGCNSLIREGAYLTESADDVLRLLAEMTDSAFEERRRKVVDGITAKAIDEKEVSKDRTKIHQALGYGPTDIDDIVRDTGASPASVSIVLLELELAGRLERQHGNKVSLISAGST